MRTYLWTVGHETLSVAHYNRWWMSWNLFLAAVPALMAVLLFHRPHRHTALWWAAVAVFVLFLPNAPYVVTDLIHVRMNIRSSATLHGTVVFGILPIYALFVIAGFVCYAGALYEVGRAVARSSWAPWSRFVQLALHAACAVGVLIGRVPHINSWSVVTHPRLAVSLSAHTLSNPAAPLVVVMLFGVIWLGFESTKAVALTAHRSWLHVRAVSPRTNVR